MSDPMQKVKRATHKAIDEVQRASQKAFQTMHTLVDQGKLAEVDKVREQLAKLLAGARCGCAPAKGGGKASKATRHKVAVYVIEQMAKGTNMLLPAICSDVFAKQGPEAYGVCHEVLDALSQQGNQVRKWLFEGMRDPKTGAWMKPAPAGHIAEALGFPR